MSSQAIALAIAPKVGGLLSILGSSWIFLEVMGNAGKRKLVYHRLMFMLSLFDIIVSSAAFASTWPMTPDGDPWGAIGNEVTCNIQGFALQLGSTLFCYNAFLSIFFVLVINFSVPEPVLRKYELGLHIFPVVFGLTTAIIPVVKNYYHNANLWCWIAVDPECIDGEDSESCDGFDKFHIYRMTLFFGPLWVCFLIELVCLCAVFRGVRHQEQRSRRHTQHATGTISRGTAWAWGRHGRSSNTDAEQYEASFTATAIVIDLPRTKQVASQAALYILAFYLTYIFATINRILQQVDGFTPFWVVIMHSLTLPLQGFWNFFIYRRPTYLRLRRDNTRWGAIKDCLVLSWFKNPRHQRPAPVSQPRRPVASRRLSMSSWLSVHLEEIEQENIEKLREQGSGKEEPLGGEERDSVHNNGKKKYVTFAEGEVYEVPNDGNNQNVTFAKGEVYEPHSDVASGGFHQETARAQEQS
jgi:hypothetical protein